MSEYDKRGSRAPVTAPVVPAPEPVVEAAPAPEPRRIEVDLIRRYCPIYVPQADGSLVANVDEVKATIDPGVYSLHFEDATHVLRSGAAQPTRATFKDV